MLGLGAIFKVGTAGILAAIIAFGVGHAKGYRGGFEDGVFRASAKCRANGGQIEVDTPKRKRIFPKFFSPVPTRFEGLPTEAPPMADGPVADVKAFEAQALPDQAENAAVLEAPVDGLPPLPDEPPVVPVPEEFK